MNRYKKTFDKLKAKREKALIPFVVIGDPDYATSIEIAKTIIGSGADILELGFPFSDPIADGPTIQAADVRALKKGLNTDKCFEFIKNIRETTEIPIGILVYSNLIYQRGIKKFYLDAKRAGVDSVLVADLPLEEAGGYIREARENDIASVFIVSPLTDSRRLASILRECRGFVYIVSRLGVTGAREELEENTLKLIKRVRKSTKLPLCVGFGISKEQHVKAVCKAGANGAIVGSALVRLIEDNLKNKEQMLKKIRGYTASLKQATKLG